MVKNDEQGIFSVELGLNNWGALAVAGLAIQERPYKDEVGNVIGVCAKQLSSITMGLRTI